MNFKIFDKVTLNGQPAIVWQFVPNDFGPGEVQIKMLSDGSYLTVAPSLLTPAPEDPEG